MKNQEENMSEESDANEKMKNPESVKNVNQEKKRERTDSEKTREAD